MKEYGGYIELDTYRGREYYPELLALNIFSTFYGRAGWEGVGQAKAVVFFILVGIIAVTQNVLTRRKEIEQ